MYSALHEMDCRGYEQSVRRAQAFIKPVTLNAPTPTLRRRVLYGQPDKKGRKMSDFCFVI